MVKIFLDKDASLQTLENQTVAVIGYGNQGRAQALNFRDSGLNVVVGLRKGGASWERSKKDGFSPLEISAAAEQANIVHILIPDQVQPRVYREEIQQHMEAEKTLGFSHGFNILYKMIVPPSDVDVVMVAPKSPGSKMRTAYEAGFGVPALLAVERDYTGSAKNKALAMAKALGCTKAGVIETSFKHEAESDLIGEQTVLCGGLMELIKIGFDNLIESGYAPELAYFEACNEAKLIMDLIYEGGLVGMLKGVSDTAKFGAVTAGSKVIDEHVRENMRKIVKEVRNGDFARKWVETASEDPTYIERTIQELQNSQLETVGRSIRKMSGLEK